MGNWGPSDVSGVQIVSAEEDLHAKQRSRKENTGTALRRLGKYLGHSFVDRKGSESAKRRGFSRK